MKVAKALKSKTPSVLLNDPFINFYSIFFYLLLYLITSLYSSTVLLKVLMVLYLTSLLVYTPALLILFLKFTSLYFSDNTFCNCTPFNTTIAHPVSTDKYSLFKSIFSTWIFYQQICIISLYRYYVQFHPQFPKFYSVFLFLCAFNNMLLFFLPKRIISFVLHVTLFFIRPNYFKILMLLHSTRNSKLEYNFQQLFHPFTFYNLENFFKLETFGVELLYLNRRFTLIYFYKKALPFTLSEFNVLEEPENLQLESIELPGTMGTCYWEVEDTDDFLASEPHSLSPERLLPQAGLNQCTRFTILGIAQEVMYRYNRILLSFPVECLNLFKLYFKFIEKTLIDLQVLDKVEIYCWPHLNGHLIILLKPDGRSLNSCGFMDTRLIISRNQDGFDLEPFTEFVLNPYEGHKDQHFSISIKFKDSDDFLKFLSIQPDLRFIK